MHSQQMPRKNPWTFAIRKLLAPMSVCLLLFGPGTLAVQNQPPPPPRPSAKENAMPSVHRFWDAENVGLFAGVGGARMLDYISTRHFRDRGVNEWLLSNRIVDNRLLFVGIELAATAASVGVSYAFHRTGHHKLERWVSIVHLGTATGGSIRNFTLKNSTSGLADSNY
jgi:hypothetical protein